MQSLFRGLVNHLQRILFQVMWHKVPSQKMGHPWFSSKEYPNIKHPPPFYHCFYPLVMTNIAMENPPIFHGKIHYFYGDLPSFFVCLPVFLSENPLHSSWFLGKIPWGMVLHRPPQAAPRWSTFAPHEGRLRRGLTRPGEGRRRWRMAFLGHNTYPLVI